MYIRRGATILGLVSAAMFAGMTPQVGAKPLPQTTTTPWTTPEIERAALQINTILRTTPLAGTHVGIVAIDAQRGTPLYMHNASDTFVPGSLVKLITGITALQVLGPEYRFTTRLTANNATYTLQGDGDPQLSRAVLREAVHAARLAGAGPQTPVQIDDRAFAGEPYPVGWSIADRPFDYAAPISAVSLDENTLHFTVSPTAPGRLPTIQIAANDRAALAPYVVIRNHAQTIAAGGSTTVDAAWFDRGTGETLPATASLGLGIAGTIAADARAQTIDAAIPYPRAFIAQQMAAYALSDTSAVGPPRSGTLWTHRSKPLAAMLPDMWLHSDNFMAECWLRALAGASPGHPVTADDGAVRELQVLQKMAISPHSLMLVDGSGLSRQNAVPPRVFTNILQRAYMSDLRRTVLNALPVAGVSGTLGRRFRGTSLAGAVFAKTGSLTNVSNIAGYLQTPRHGMIVFAISADDALIEDQALHALQAQILTALQK